MGLTVKDVSKFSVMSKARVRAGKEVLDEHCVQWISAIEMPVENFVRKNEVVLSTGVGCEKDPSSLRQFVEDVIESEASALILALGRFIFDIPSDIIELAEENQFIIIEIPWEIRFSDIIEEVMQELNAIQQKEQKTSEKIQQELLKLILEDAELDQISSYIQNSVGCPVVITDQAGVLLDKKSIRPALVKKWESYVVNGVIPVRELAAPLTQDPMFHKFQTIEVEGEVLLQLPVLQVLDDPQGYLYALLPVPPHPSAQSFLTTYRVNILEHAVTTINLWLSRQNAIEKTKMRLRSDFVQELAKGEFISWDQAHSRAKLLGYNIQLPYVCIIGYPENFKKLFNKRKQDYQSFNHWLDSMIRYVEEETFYAAQSLKREVMITYQEEQIILFLESAGEQKPENASAFLDLVERRLNNLLPEVVISWGIGDYKENLKGFEHSYEHAKMALEIGRRKKGPGNRTMYENTRIDRVLLEIARNENMKEVVMSTIEPLIRYDSQRNMDLIETFSTYNRCNGNVSQTARILNLHRQSLLYRLRKIESLTGLALIDPDDLFLLELSIKIWKMAPYETKAAQFN
ncbi:PucR family transcriptional regulator [Bacillus thermotolerans]|uniref:PucR family transcriptional regulator n=1 Tax=Bacillus thermotolerans TaxID=1221996 RepID=A0A0F5HTZ0_BACTR|nr:PucR family transcriptional regulator [Bacillus thermotolerans]KKB36327.1 hypothetical protein QY95_03191 [Bacillus thermotolerans]